MIEAAAPPTAPLTARGIRKSFSGVEVLHGVDLHLRPGRVLALLGENGAGKSTLVKILAGDYQPDAGEIEVAGTRHATLEPLQARRLGIRMIHQELTDAPTLSVAENISLGRWPTHRGRVSWQAMRERAREVLAQLGAEINVDAPVAGLRVGERQIVEIARALSDQARVLILDEPTAALSADEVMQLFGFIARLRDRGVAMIYITHRLDEVGRVADEVQVLRDGETVAYGAVTELSRDALVTAMIGRSAVTLGRPSERSLDPAAPPALELVAAGLPDQFTEVSLRVAPGEIVALYGKVGSGIAEVAETVFGRHRLSAGRLEIDGRPVSFTSPREAINAGVGFLPADRQREAAFSIRPVAQNLAAPSWRRLARHGLLTARSEARIWQRWRSALSIRAPADASRPIVTLSGGNQQKVLLARWLERRSRVLVLVEPTRGVDVGARAEIYATLRALAADERVAVLVATSDYEEVVQLADRALVMARGRIVAEFAGLDVTTTALTRAAGG